MSQRRTAIVNTLEGVLSKLEGFDISNLESGGIAAKSFPYELTFASTGAMWYWKMAAVDDPEDSDEGVSDNPIVEIAEFLGADIPGGGYFKNLASNPSELSRVIRKIALRARHTNSKKLANMIRRVVVAINVALVKREPEFVKIQNRAVNKLKKEMEGQGWRVKEYKDDADLPVLHVNVSDVYEGDIRVESLTYAYKFVVEGEENVTEEGITDDPLGELKSWAKRRDVDRAITRAKESGASTLPAPPGLMEEDKKTVGPKKK
jgi:hypothetical protein